MEYTREEKELITRAFEITRMEFEKDPDPENDEHVIIALKKYKNSYHMGPERQKIATEIFRKNGLWKNGKTPLEEYNKKLLEEKLEQTIRLKNAQERHVSQLKELRGTIDSKITELETKPVEIAKNLLEKRKELQVKAYEQLDITGKKLQDHLKETADRLNEEYNETRNNILRGLEREIEQLKKIEHAEIERVLEEYDELTKLKEEYGTLIHDHEKEEKQIKQEMEKTDASLFDLTIRELKEIADDKGLEYSQRILKADLVDLIENKDNNEIIFEE